MTRSSERTRPAPTVDDSTHGASRGLGILMLIAGLVGMVASTVLTVERLALAENPDYVPSCNFSPLLSCGSVVSTWQASLFGFPNPLIGIAGFAVIAGLATALLSGARFARWMWLLVQVGVTFGIVFVTWLMSQSIFVIGYLCPYCMVVWTVMIPLFWFTTMRVASMYTDAAWLRSLREWSVLVVTLWYLAVVTTILVVFWDYWSSLL